MQVAKEFRGYYRFFTCDAPDRLRTLDDIVKTPYRRAGKPPLEVPMQEVDHIFDCFVWTRDNYKTLGITRPPQEGDVFYLRVRDRGVLTSFAFVVVDLRSAKSDVWLKDPTADWIIGNEAQDPHHVLYALESWKYRN